MCVFSYVHIVKNIDYFFDLKVAFQTRFLYD